MAANNYLEKSFNNRPNGPNDCFARQPGKGWENQCYIIVPPDAITKKPTKWLQYCCEADSDTNIFQTVDGCGWQCITNRTLAVDQWWNKCIYDDWSPLKTGYGTNLTKYEVPTCANRKALEKGDQDKAKNSGVKVERGLGFKGLVVLAILVPALFV
ncbi:hypothetical protein ABW19_dt0201253 [Dactylella cylindrospora]|nr:hypothetical protein ABW19_dt0201253 [Dactylella cylindrospora]